MGGGLGVESVQQKEEQAFVARVNTARSLPTAHTHVDTHVYVHVVMPSRG